MRLTNKISQNLHAELLLRVAAKENAAAMTLEDALAFAEQFRQSIGLSSDDVMLADGSGLSRNNLATPQSMVQLLLYAARQPWGADFVTTLPVAGQDGTLENRMKGTAAGRVRAKTGSYSHVDSLGDMRDQPAWRTAGFLMFGNNLGGKARDAVRCPGHDSASESVEELGTGGAKECSAAPDEITGPPADVTPTIAGALP